MGLVLTYSERGYKSKDSAPKKKKENKRERHPGGWRPDLQKEIETMREDYPIKAW